MQYVPPLRILSGAGTVERSETRIALPLEAFFALLRAAFAGAAFDADWYIATYPDVATAISDGIVPDAVTHFVRFGYFENRRPRAFEVNPSWYESAYQDVASAIRSGAISDAQSHYNANGYFEARAPDADSAAAFATLLTVVAARSPSTPTAMPAASVVRRRPRRAAER